MSYSRKGALARILSSETAHYRVGFKAVFKITVQRYLEKLVAFYHHAADIKVNFSFFLYFI